MTADESRTDRNEDAEDTIREPEQDAHAAHTGQAKEDEERGGPGKTDMTGAGSGRMATSGVESSEDEHAKDRGAGKDGPTPNPAMLAP